MDTIYSRRGAQRGFTLVELIAVMILIGLLSVAAYSRLGGNEYDAAGYRDQVAATVAYARKASIAQRRYVQVSLAANALQFRIANDVPEGAERANFSSGTSRALVLPGVGAAGIAPRGASTLTGPATLVFTPLGTTSNTALTYVYTIAGAPSYTITVDPVSGHVY